MCFVGYDKDKADLDNMPYTTLLYGNGPGHSYSSLTGRRNLTGVNPHDINFIQQAAVPRR